MTEPTPVLIVGGGTTGLSAALFLARQGMRPILVERHPHTAITPKARAFTPRSLEIYRGCGLEREILGRQSALTRLPAVIGMDTLAGEIRFSDAVERPPATGSPSPWAMVDQDELEQLLRDAAAAAGAEVRFGTEMISLDAGPDGVTAVVRRLDDGVEYGIRADYVIAADGHRAGIRGRLGIGADGPGTLHSAVHFVFEADLDAVLGDRRFFLAYLDKPVTGSVIAPLRTPGRWLLGVPDHPALAGDLDRVPDEFCVELVRQAVGVPDLDVTLVPLVPGWAQKLTRVRIGGWVASRYRAGRVFFAGDAAHVVPPAGSLGANTGIADAHNLAWKLTAVVNGHAGAELLDSYEAERRPVAQQTLHHTMRLMRARHSAGAEEIEGIDDVAVTSGYRYRSAAVVTPKAANPKGSPGLRAPHVWLAHGDARLSTVDLFDGFTMLAGPDGSDWATAVKSVADAVPIRLHVIGVELHDVEHRFLTSYGITRTGATLVRPDGFIAWRAVHRPERPDEELLRALSQVLARG
jgi:putative polyketide hydroxylase